ncbi:MAG: TlyA family RNA methyltransferase [Verrucomicrobiota bacterium]
MKKLRRLDQYLVENELVVSRTQAQRFIRSGQVSVNGRVVTTASVKVQPEDDIEVTGKDRFVGRGGEKLEAALRQFEIDVTDLCCLDVGASTGGFTDCLLQRGVDHVTAIDVGHGQMVEVIRTDPRVTVIEKCNARSLQKNHFDRLFDLIVVDVSFISLLKLLDALVVQAKEEAMMILLVKPQFEVGSEGISAGGIVREEAKQIEAVEKVTQWFLNKLQWEVKGMIPCPLRGGDGNQEYLLWVSKSGK